MNFPNPSELQELLRFLTPHELAQLDKLLMTAPETAEYKLAMEAQRPKIWIPFAGPQTEALNNPATITGFGGQAGGGKTDFVLGAAGQYHTKSLIFRREQTQLPAMIERSKTIFGGWARFSGNKEKEWRFFNSDRYIKFCGVKDPGDEAKFQGWPSDLKAFDELTHFTEMQFRYLCGWLRTDKENQRCRIIATMNPPDNQDGEWVLKFFGPWLDPLHPNPAKSGELRWYTTIDGKDKECDSGEPFMHEGEMIQPISRTFIFASLADNPVYMKTGYKGMLQALPEPLRSKLLFGSFTAGITDHPMQVIPSEWIDLAHARWRERFPDGKKPTTPLSAIGADIARGGKDKTVLTPRWDNNIGEAECHPGKDTPNGQEAWALIVKRRNGSQARAQIDVIGVGASVYDLAKDKIGDLAVAMNASEGSTSRDKSGQLTFVNQRAEWFWKLRESLDPDTGDDLAMFPDMERKADLCAARMRMRTNGIQVCSKDEIKLRIGRSPDKGDSALYAHAQKMIDGKGLKDFYAALMNETRSDPAVIDQTTTQTTVGLSNW